MRSLAAYPLNPVALWTTRTGFDGGLDGRLDGIDMVRQVDARTILGGRARLEPGQGEGRDVVAVGPEPGGDVVPGPGTEPEAGDEDDVGGYLGVGGAAHGAIVLPGAGPARSEAAATLMSPVHAAVNKVDGRRKDAR